MTATLGAGMPLRGDRILRYVNAFCPACHVAAPERPLPDVRRLSGWLAERDGRVWLERGCPEHGLQRTLYDEDPEILAWLERWTAPTKAHVPDLPGNFDPLPGAYLRGLGEMQTQHTCILLEDVIEECNLRCPTCFADSSPDLAGVVPPEIVLANVDQRLARENGRIDVVMLSGGEPTLHPQFGELVEALVARPVVRILVNTNGLRLARDDGLLALLQRHRGRVEVYLQYDGSSERASRHHRGGDLRATKELALRRLSRAEIFTTLTMTATLDVNDGEIGDVLRVALATPYVGGVSIQPVFGSGRSSPVDPLRRLTHTGTSLPCPARTRTARASGTSCATTRDGGARWSRSSGPSGSRSTWASSPTGWPTTRCPGRCGPPSGSRSWACCRSRAACRTRRSGTCGRTCARRATSGSAR